MVLIAYVALEGAFAAALNGDDRRSYWRITRHACYKLGVLGFVYKIMLSSQMIPLWEQFDSREASMGVLSMLMLPAVFLLVMWGGRNEFRQQVEWARLDLSEELPV